MLYTTRAIAEALGVHRSAVYNDVTRGVLQVHVKDKIGNRFTHKEAVGYYKYRETLDRKYLMPNYQTYLRTLVRCTQYQLTVVYGLHRTAKALGIDRSLLATENRNYLRTNRRILLRKKRITHAPTQA